MSTRQGAPIMPTSASGIPAGDTRRCPTPPSSSKGPPSASLQPPPLPYVRGAHFEIKPHNPAPPFDNGSGYDNPDAKEWNPNPWPFGDDAPKGIVAQYLAHPPRKPRDKTPPKDQVKHNLVVTQQIRCGDDCLAQVVRCLVDGEERVAKIFDPLYVEINRCNEYGFPPTYYSERFYSCEAAAYKRIKESGLDGRYTPKFYDCWFLELPLPIGKGDVVCREVCLILQEFIPGDTIEALMKRGEAEKIHPDTRVDLLDRLMEAISHLTFIGVINDDEHPRNFMVTKDAKDGWQITLIDFSHSRVRDLPNSTWWTTTRIREQKRPESPMTVLRHCWPPHCSGWIPEKCDGRTEAALRERLEHMEKRWGNSPEYEPVDRRKLNEYIGFLRERWLSSEDV
ncbi:hypothetical protein F5883DRAFT_707055 [Diaporthe sp. PMI_573]|nr:hypothetical protein F5883DRAFT_707055 [Diaporthaceae sp. PMI_573]